MIAAASGRWPVAGWSGHPAVPVDYGVFVVVVGGVALRGGGIAAVGSDGVG